MSTSYSTNARFQTPAPADLNWNTAINANMAFLDGVQAIGGLCCVPTETPSTTLDVQISAGSYHKATGAVGTYAGGTTAVTASATNYLWLTDAGVLTLNTTGFPTSSPIVQLAVVVAGSATITTVTDSRIAYGSATTTSYLPLSGGTLSGSLTVLAGTTAIQAMTVGGDVTIADTHNLILNTGTGTKIGTATSQKLGFWNATPIIQPAGSAQAALTDSTTGTAGTTVNDGTGTYSQTITNNNNATILALLGAIRTALVNAGLMKGSA
jgi:hypothetical protein